MESVDFSFLCSIRVPLQVPEPVELVYHIMKDLESTKQQKSRFLLRLLPIEATCKVCIQQAYNCIWIISLNFNLIIVMPMLIWR